MVKTHEMNLSTSAFNQFTNNNYIIVEAKEVEVNDYILFHQVEVVEGETTQTGLFSLVQVKDIITHQGLKEGYVLLIVRKFD